MSKNYIPKEQEIRWELIRYKQLQDENEKLKEILYVIGELAVISSENSIMGLVNRTLPKGYTISKECFEQVLKAGEK